MAKTGISLRGDSKGFSMMDAIVALAIISLSITVISGGALAAMRGARAINESVVKTIEARNADAELVVASFRSK